jgi:hypothetical protein
MKAIASRIRRDVAVLRSASPQALVCCQASEVIFARRSTRPGRRGQKPEQIMGKEKRENTGKDVDKDAEHKKRIARESDRTIKKELKVEKPDVRRGKGRGS